METCAAAVILIYKTEEEKIKKERKRKKKKSRRRVFSPRRSGESGQSDRIISFPLAAVSPSRAFFLSFIFSVEMWPQSERVSASHSPVLFPLPSPNEKPIHGAAARSVCI
jgi:hypothetical protein